MRLPSAMTTGMRLGSPQERDAIICLMAWITLRSSTAALLAATGITRSTYNQNQHQRRIQGTSLLTIIFTLGLACLIKSTIVVYASMMASVVFPFCISFVPSMNCTTSGADSCNQP